MKRVAYAARVSLWLSQAGQIRQMRTYAFTCGGSDHEIISRTIWLYHRLV